MPVKLQFGDNSSKVLPEVVSIVEEMIRLYNTWEGSTTYLKLESNKVGIGESPTSARYELYDSKAALFEAILQNCPAGCSIISK
jgi:hypothetical protein